MVNNRKGQHARRSSIGTAHGRSTLVHMCKGLTGSSARPHHSLPLFGGSINTSRSQHIVTAHSHSTKANQRDGACAAAGWHRNQQVRRIAEEEACMGEYHACMGSTKHVWVNTKHCSAHRGARVGGVVPETPWKRTPDRIASRSQHAAHKREHKKTMPCPATRGRGGMGCGAVRDGL